MIKYIFIIPYRNREEQKHFFIKYMNYLMEDYDKESYEIIFAHQNNNLQFNRGAMKNIGFLYAKQKYSYYKDIIFIFNDVDTLPHKKNLLNFDLEDNQIKHYYGFYFTLGGIFAIKGNDFEKINGFPNLWGWGYEDNLLQYRVLRSGGLTIDRGQFHALLDKNILQLKDGVERTVNRSEFDKYMANTPEGINSITNLNYVINDDTGFVDIYQFNTGREENVNTRKVHDLRNGSIPYTPAPKNIRRGATMGMVLQR